MVYDDHCALKPCLIVELIAVHTNATTTFYYRAASFLFYFYFFDTLLIERR